MRWSVNKTNRHYVIWAKIYLNKLINLIQKPHNSLTLNQISEIMLIINDISTNLKAYHDSPTTHTARNHLRECKNLLSSLRNLAQNVLY